MDELFYPRVSLTIRPLARNHLIHGTSSGVTKLLKPNARTASTILTIVLLLCLIGLFSEIRQMKRSLEACSTAMASSWDESLEPITVTTTVHTSSYTKWWFGETTSTTPSSVTPATPYGSANIWSPQTSPAYLSDVSIRAATLTTPVGIELSSSSRPESTELIPYVDWHFLSLADLKLHPAARFAVDKVMDGLGVVWQVLRKAYHYPLEPPL